MHIRPEETQIQRSQSKFVMQDIHVGSSHLNKSKYKNHEREPEER